MIIEYWVSCITDNTKHSIETTSRWRRPESPISPLVDKGPVNHILLVLGVKECFTKYFPLGNQTVNHVCNTQICVCDHHKILHMLRQHCCRSMCKILWWYNNSWIKHQIILWNLKIEKGILFVKHFPEAHYSSLPQVLLKAHNELPAWDRGRCPRILSGQPKGLSAPITITLLESFGIFKSLATQLFVAELSGWQRCNHQSSEGIPLVTCGFPHKGQ